MGYQQNEEALMLEQLKKDLDGKSFWIEYEDRRNATTRRLITPICLLFHDSWGLLAWCHEREDARWFRVDAIRVADPVDRMKTFTPQEVVRCLVGGCAWENQVAAAKTAIDMEKRQENAERIDREVGFNIWYDKPQFVPDCSECTFLAHITSKKQYDGGSDCYDLHYCEQHGLPTVIARFGHEGSEYISGMEIAKVEEAQGRKNHPLVIAMNMAKLKGLIG